MHHMRQADCRGPVASSDILKHNRLQAANCSHITALGPVTWMQQAPTAVKDTNGEMQLTQSSLAVNKPHLSAGQQRMATSLQVKVGVACVACWGSMHHFSTSSDA